ncbi:hypothetical protein BJX64DRAFT_278578 [Aspergillus heterothallicus]
MFGQLSCCGFDVGDYGEQDSSAETRVCKQLFIKGHYCPVRIGDVSNQSPTIKVRGYWVGKSDFGVSSAVWFALDLEGHQYVILKVYARDEDHQDEFKIYSQLSQRKSLHPGSAHIREVPDTLIIPSLAGDNYFNNLHLLKAGLMQIFLSLNYLHRDGDSILQEIEDTSVLESFAKAEMESPSPRKLTNSAPDIWPGMSLKHDFGSAVRGNEKRNHNAQPNVYRSPEVMLKVGTWYGNDPDGKGYSTRAHLAEVTGNLGPPPLDSTNWGTRSHEFFTEDEQDIEIQTDTRKNKEMFLDFKKGILHWQPEDRKTVNEVLDERWLNGEI